MREVLGADPWERQAEILEALAREPRVTVRSCNGAGKTLCASWAVLWFLMTRPSSIVVTTAPTGRQVRDLLWRRIRTAYQGARQPLHGRCMTTFLECGTEWYATGFATDQEVNFQGPHSPHGILFVGDEASGLAEWLFAAMQGSMTEPEAKMLLIGNPNVAAGYFYESHQRWESAQRFHISAFDVPERVLQTSFREGIARDYGEESAVYQVRVLGEFPEQGENSLISMRWVDAAQNALCDEREPIEIGVDVARFGGDENVAYVRRGRQVVDARYWRGQDTMTSAGRVLALAQEWQPSLVKVDVIGVGAGVVDRLEEMRQEKHAAWTIRGVNVGEAARDSEKLANKRSEIFWGLRERFRDGDIAIPAEDAELRKQLISLLYGYTSRGQLKLESKEDMAKRGLPSPDRADALALCFAAEVGSYQPYAEAGEERDWE